MLKEINTKPIDSKAAIQDYGPCHSLMLFKLSYFSQFMPKARKDRGGEDKLPGVSILLK